MTNTIKTAMLLGLLSAVLMFIGEASAAGRGWSSASSSPW